jgi:serine/threonine-protein kinase RIO1
MPAHERQAWLRELKRHYQAGGGQRLEAMRLARAWGQREVLPLVQQGLRDPDPLVMREAALAMESFRGRPNRPTPKRQDMALPRNVARTR